MASCLLFARERTDDEGVIGPSEAKQGLDRRVNGMQAGNDGRSGTGDRQWRTAWSEREGFSRQSFSVATSRYRQTTRVGAARV